MASLLVNSIKKCTQDVDVDINFIYLSCANKSDIVYTVLPFGRWFSFHAGHQFTRSKVIFIVCSAVLCYAVLCSMVRQALKNRKA